ncbi:MAG: hypothetical protein NT013_26955 [Planctomycetia bacterium]|nr:hypothetical protein [Planctomycetia bacterium]
MSNSLRNIVVFEPRSRWEPELQRQFGNEAVRVCGCRTIKELSSLVFPKTIINTVNATEISDVVVLQVSENAASCLQWITGLATQPQAPAVVVLCSPESAELEWALRDAGVLEVMIDEYSGQRLARCCRRLW